MNDSPMIAGRGKKRLFKRVEPFFYLLPAAAFFAIFTFYPFIKTIYSSFFLVNAKGEIRSFVGLENYIHVLSDPKFIKSIGNTLLYVALSSPVAIAISLLLAMLCCNKTKTSSIYETMFAITMAMSLSVTAMIFNLLYNPTIGALNHLVGQKIRWLGDPKIAMISLSIIAVWMNIGYNFLFLLAAVRGVPAELLESAEVDGAGTVKKVFKIVIPLISPTVFFLICNSLAKNMMMSGLVLILTEGGPQGSTQTMISYMFQQSINNQNYNDGFAAAIIAFILTFAAMCLSFAFEKKGVHYQ
ncbi:sugar ABC transporter permease [Clostridium sp. MCC353]|uniref:carbohydrate ABC transporter permease n=1 Tax=Clostridium sp. MCC353 TaxID=2592646 RepID=UPI00207A1E6F|nr:sugar ABC transporter permease [Clostridium sp. MCC353]